MNEIDLKKLIDIPKELDNVVLTALEKGKKDKSNENRKKNILKRSTIAAAIVLSSTIALGTINPNIANAFPTINRIFETFNTSLFGESTEKYQDAAQVIGTCVKNKRASITLNEAAFDDNVLMLALTIESDLLKGYTGSNENDFLDFDQDISLNGNSISSASSKVKIINETTGAAILTCNVADLSLDSSADIELTIHHLGRGDLNILGSWNFNFNLKKQSDGKKISINPSIKYADFEINEVNLTTTNLSNTLIIKGNSKDSSDKQICPKLLVKDNNNNLFIADLNDSTYSNINGDFTTTYEVKGDLSNSNHLEIMPRNFEDSISEEHNGLNYSILKCTGFDNGEYERFIISRPINKHEKELRYSLDTMDYYMFIDKEKEFKSINDLIGSEIQVSSSEVITIKNIESTNKYTKIIFESKGLYNYKNFSETTLFDEQLNDTARKEGGLTAAIEDLENGLFSMTLDPLDNTKKYKIAIPIMPEVNLDNPEWTINIPLN